MSMRSAGHRPDDRHPARRDSLADDPRLESARAAGPALLRSTCAAWTLCWRMVIRARTGPVGAAQLVVEVLTSRAVLRPVRLESPAERLQRVRGLPVLVLDRDVEVRHHCGERCMAG